MRLSAISLAILLSFVAPLRAEEITVAAASDLNFAMNELIPAFERESGCKVRLTLGSSGNLYAQIVNGAPFDVFLPADVRYGQELEKAGRAAEGSTSVYAVGSIVLWAPKTSKLNLTAQGMHALLDPSVKKIAIANPDHAPYGQAAVAAMQAAKLYDRVKEKLVMGENIAQAAQFVQSGAADIGVIALSIAISAPMRQAGSYWTIPLEMYPPLRQAAVPLKRAQPCGKSFVDWLRGREAREILGKYGFRPKS